MSAPLSNDARSDLREIYLYLTKIPSAPAKRTLKAIRDVLDELPAHPYRGRPEPVFTDLVGVELRSMRAGSYRIFYRVDQVQVIAILHGARDFQSILQRRVQ